MSTVMSYLTAFLADKCSERAKNKQWIPLLDKITAHHEGWLNAS